ncbi:MAG: FHA domain-containing protein [Anaerolineae bacterium]|nr:FHA domain-containing protein [Anaerolineae bacterium]
MKHARFIGIIACVLVAFAIAVVPGGAQGTGPLFIIHGKPIANRTGSPDVDVFTSVIDRETAESIAKLTRENFTLHVLEETIAMDSMSYEAVGLAVVFVIDRGGISARGDTRIKDATNLVRDMVGKLDATGASNDDMMAIIGIGEGGVLEPQEDFTYNAVDKNRVLNALNIMDDQAVNGATPLFEGVDKALDYLLNNQNYRAELEHRRKIMLVFSDGVDNASEIAQLQDVWSKAAQAGISIYTIGMAQGANGNLSANADDTLKRMAYQTGGLYHLHNGSTHQQVLDFFDQLRTQRYQYVLTFANARKSGVYPLTVEVETHFGIAEEQTEFDGILALPSLALISPNNDDVFFVPYSETSEASEMTTIEMRVSLAFGGDQVERFPSEVQYYAGGSHIGTGTESPEFPFAWEVSSQEKPTFDTLDKTYTLSARAVDSLLGEAYEAQAPVTIKVSWGAKPTPTPVPTSTPLPVSEQLVEDVKTNWWVLAIFLLLSVGLVVLFLLFLKARKDLVAQGQRPTIRQTVTQVLDPNQRRRRLGTLTVLRGAGGAREFTLTEDVTVLGRDDKNLCNIQLHDEFVSSRHFTIRFERSQNQFYIIDEGSRNKTFLDGTELSPNQPTFLKPNSIIRVGDTELQFQVGSVTRKLAP